MCIHINVKNEFDCTRNSFQDTNMGSLKKWNFIEICPGKNYTDCFSLAGPTRFHIALTLGHSVQCE